MVYRKFFSLSFIFTQFREALTYFLGWGKYVKMTNFLFILILTQGIYWPPVLFPPTASVQFDNFPHSTQDLRWSSSSWFNFHVHFTSLSNPIAAATYRCEQLTSNWTLWSRYTTQASINPLVLAERYLIFILSLSSTVHYFVLATFTTHVTFDHATKDASWSIRVIYIKTTIFCSLLFAFLLRHPWNNLRLLCVCLSQIDNYTLLLHVYYRAFAWVAVWNHWSIFQVQDLWAQRLPDLDCIHFHGSRRNDIVKSGQSGRVTRKISKLRRRLSVKDWLYLLAITNSLLSNTIFQIFKSEGPMDSRCFLAPGQYI